MTSDAGSRVFTMFRTGACVVGPQMTGSAESPEKRRYMAPTNMASTTTAAAATRNKVGSPGYGPPLAVIQRGGKFVSEKYALGRGRSSFTFHGAGLMLAVAKTGALRGTSWTSTSAS